MHIPSIFKIYTNPLSQWVLFCQIPCMVFPGRTGAVSLQIAHLPPRILACPSRRLWLCPTLQASSTEFPGVPLRGGSTSPVGYRWLECLHGCATLPLAARITASGFVRLRLPAERPHRQPPALPPRDWNRTEVQVFCWGGRCCCARAVATAGTGMISHETCLDKVCWGPCVAVKLSYAPGVK